MELHQLWVIFMLPQSAEDAGHILCRCFPDGGQVAVDNVRLAVAKNTLNGGVVQYLAELPQHAFPDSQHTLVRPEFPYSTCREPVGAR